MIARGVFERQALRVAAVLVAYLAVTGLARISHTADGLSGGATVVVLSVCDEQERSWRRLR
jgi:hypothetical protein